MIASLNAAKPNETGIETLFMDRNTTYHKSDDSIKTMANSVSNWWEARLWLVACICRNGKMRMILKLSY